MNRKIVLSALTSILILSSIGIGVQFIKPAKASPTTWTVDDDGPADFQTIQEAINMAERGDTVLVASGMYYENLIVDKSISLVGENRSTTVIDGGRTGTVVDVTGDSVTVTGFTVQNSGSDQHGILLENSHNTNVTGNIVSNNGFGIWLDYSDGNTVSDNTVSSNSWSGMYLKHSHDNIINNNDISNNMQAIELDASDSNLVNYNTITNNHLGVQLSGPEVGMSEWNTIHNNVIIHNRLGVRLWDANNNILGNNTVTNGELGIKLEGYGNIIGNNTIAINECGILLDECRDNIIYHNNLVKNRQQVDSIRSYNTWDDGYPSGGNFWSDYREADEYKGPNQDQPGSDGIGDAPYIIDEDNKDGYPLMNPLFTHEHDLAVTVWALTSIITGTPTTLQVALCNLGLSNETDVHLQLLIDGVKVESEIVPELASGLAYAVNCSWTPTTEGIYNITACVIAIPEEYTTINNVRWVTVSVYTPVVGPTTVCLHPSESSVVVDDVLIISLTIANVTDLYCWQVVVYYRNDVLEVAEVTEGPFLKTGGTTIWPTPQIWNDYNATHGCVMLGCTLLGEVPGVNGSGVLARIKFKAIALGSSVLEIDRYDTLIVDSAIPGNEMPFEARDGYVTVTRGIEGDLNDDGIVDIRDITVFALAFGSYPGHPRWNANADIDSNGVVDIRDAVKIAKNFGKTY